MDNIRVCGRELRAHDAVIPAPGIEPRFPGGPAIAGPVDAWRHPIGDIDNIAVNRVHENRRRGESRIIREPRPAPAAITRLPGAAAPDSGIGYFGV